SSDLDTQGNPGQLNTGNNNREVLAASSAPLNPGLSFPPQQSLAQPFGTGDQFPSGSEMYSRRNPLLVRRHQPRQPALKHRPNPYADVPSLFDLYSQYTASPAALERFGAEIFRNGTGNFDDLPMDMPVGPEYVLGSGDGLNVDLWGGISQRLVRAVDRQG